MWYAGESLLCCLEEPDIKLATGMLMSQNSVGYISIYSKLHVSTGELLHPAGNNPPLTFLFWNYTSMPESTPRHPNCSGCLHRCAFPGFWQKFDEIVHWQGSQKAGDGKWNVNYVVQKRCRECERPQVWLPGKALQFSITTDLQELYHHWWIFYLSFSSVYHGPVTWGFCWKMSTNGNAILL